MPVGGLGWKHGDKDREVLAPVADVEPSYLLKQNYHAMGALLSPLWQLQCDVITELLERARGSGVPVVD